MATTRKATTTKAAPKAEPKNRKAERTVERQKLATAIVRKLAETKEGQGLLLGALMGGPLSLRQMQALADEVAPMLRATPKRTRKAAA